MDDKTLHLSYFLVGNKPHINLKLSSFVVSVL